jgi:hypothetical protein
LVTLRKCGDPKKLALEVMSRTSWIIVGSVVGGILALGFVCLVFLVLLLALASAGSQGQSAGSQVTEQAPSKQVTGQFEQSSVQAKKSAAQKPIEISATDIIKEYSDNKARAKVLYEGKVVQVTGEVRTVTERYAVLKGTRKFEHYTVDCHFADLGVLASLQPGTTVTIVGTCTGHDVFGINIRKCRLVAE